MPNRFGVSQPRVLDIPPLLGQACSSRQPIPLGDLLRRLGHWGQGSSAGAGVEPATFPTWPIHTGIRSGGVRLLGTLYPVELTHHAAYLSPAASFNKSINSTMISFTPVSFW